VTNLGRRGDVESLVHEFDAVTRTSRPEGLPIGLPEGIAAERLAVSTMGAMLTT
jgi:hypothetical protein